MATLYKIVMYFEAGNFMFKGTVLWTPLVIVSLGCIPTNAYNTKSLKTWTQLQSSKLQENNERKTALLQNMCVLYLDAYRKRLTRPHVL